MKNYFISIVYFWFLLNIFINPNTNITEVIIILTGLACYIIKEKFCDEIVISMLFLLAAVLTANINESYLLLGIIPVLDSASKKKWLILAGSIVVLSYYAFLNNSLFYIVPILMGGVFGYLDGDKLEKEKKYIEVLDQERRLRYQLEQTKNKLLNSRKEIKRLTEIKERNRIARQIHDTIGHSIAGILFQLQAAVKLHKKDNEKTEKILKICVDKLSETLELTRKTVYNIKDEGRGGLKAIKEIINDYNYCKIDFEYSGNFNKIPADIQEIALSNITEALTNTTKYSAASKVKININVGEKMLRLYYKDNGQGCQDIKENMGLTGMRERIINTGGTISIDGNNGFLIVCNIPLKGR